MIRFGTFGHTYLDLGGPSMPAANSGDSVTFGIRNLADANRFGLLGTGDYFYVLIEGEIIKITTGGKGLLTWSGVRGQCGTAAVLHEDGLGVRETVPGPAFDTFVQDPSTAAGDLLYKAAMAAPAAPSLSSATTGGTIAAGAYGVKLTKVDAHGNETLASASASITTTGTTSTITIASPTPDGIATGWNCYFTQQGGSTYTKQNTVPFALGSPYTLTTPPTNTGATPPTTTTAGSAVGALPAGTANQVLAIDATTGLPTWKTSAPSTTLQANSGGTPLSGAVQITGSGPVTVSESGQIIMITSTAAVNPMTTAGDIIYGGTAGAQTRLPVGPDGYVLTISSTTHLPVWTSDIDVAGTSIQAESGGAAITGAVILHATGPLTVTESGQTITLASSAMTNPMTTAQDLIVGGTAGAAGRLGVGGNGQVLGVTSGSVGWLNASSFGFVNPMTAYGDMISGGLSGAAQSLPIGTNGQVLTALVNGLLLATPAAPSTYDSAGGSMPSGAVGVIVTYVNAAGYESAPSPASYQSGGTNHALGVNAPAASTNAVGYYVYLTAVNGSTFYRQQAAGAYLNLSTGFFTNSQSTSGPQPPTSNQSGSFPAWQTPIAGFVNPMTTAGDLILGGTAGAAGRLAKGTDGYILTMDATTHLPIWAAAPTSGFANPMTTAGDLILGGTSGAAGRLAKGADSTVLTMDPSTHLPVWAAPTGGSGSTVQGGASTKVQLTFKQTTGLTAPTVNTWTDLIANQSFTVDDAASIVEVALSGVLEALNSSFATDVSAQIVVDSAGAAQTFPLGAIRGASGVYVGIPLGGPIALSGLAAGTHTVKLQVQADNSSTNFYVVAQAITGPTTGLTIQVLERKTTMNTSAAPVSGARLYQTAAQTGIVSGTWTQMTFDSAAFDTDTLKGTGAAPWNSLTVTKAGKYSVGANGSFNPTGLTGSGVRVKINGTIVVDDVITGVSSAASFRTASTVVDLKVGDIVTAEILQTSGGNQSTFVSGTDQFNSLYAISLGGIVSGTAQSKVQLDYVLAANAWSNSSVASGSWVDVPNTTQTFTVDDANSTVDIGVLGNIQISVAASTNVMTQLVIDPAGANTQKPIGGAVIPAGGWANALTGSGTIPVTGLAAGQHTLKLQVYLSSGTGTAYLDPVASPTQRFLRIEVIERKLVPASPSYANVDKVQLDYAATTDIFNNTALTAATWTDVVSQTFTVDDPNSDVEVSVGGVITSGGSASDVGSRLVMDPSGANTIKQLGGGFGAGFNFLAGAPGVITFSGLTAGTHTLKVQIRANSSGVTAYLLAATGPTMGLAIRVIERKVVNTGAGGTLDQVRVKSTAGTVLTTSVETPMAWDTNDTAFTTNAAMHSTSSNTTRLVAQTPGNYRFSGVVAFPANATGRRGVSLKVNGTTVEWSSAVLASSSGSTYIGFQFDYHLSATDYAEICGYQESGGSLTSFATDTWASMVRADGYAINPATTLNDMIRATTGGAPERVASTGVQGSVWTTDATGKPGWNGLLSGEAVMGANHTIASSSTWETLVSLALAAGTYLVLAQTTAVDPVTTRGLMASLWDGTTRYAPKYLVNASTSQPVELTCVAIITLPSSGTISFQAYENGASGSVYHATDVALSLPGVTRMQAFKIA